MFYIETRNTFGAWVPAKVSHSPKVKNGRIFRPESLGPIIRKMGDGYCQPIPKGYEKLTLNQLSQCLSPDGKFQHVGGKAR